MENFDMDADDNIEQENTVSPVKKPMQPSGIAMDALAGLLDSYSTTDMINSRRAATAIPLQIQQSSYSSTAKVAPTVRTPVRSATIIQASTPNAAAFHARSNKAEVVVEHIGNQSNNKNTNETKKAPVIQLKSLVKPYKSMYQTMYKRANVLNNQIEEFEDLFLSTLNDKESEKSQVLLYPIGNSVQDEVHLVGRVVCDSAGQLNGQSIVLEGSSRTSKCNRVRLDVSSLPSYSLFPGQIVLVSGIYTNDGCFHAKQLTDPPLIPRPTETKVKTDLNFMIASGPFLLANGNLSAFEELLRRAEEDPSVQSLILLGPFIDERSSYVQNLQDKTYEQVFQDLIEKIKSFRIKTILIPSLRDIHHDLIYPLSPFTINDNKDLAILYGCEPSFVSIDGLQCAITSTDILCHLSSEEISLNQTTERMCRLIRHLFQQHTFYPLIPPNESVSIEYEQAMQYAKIDSLPHLFITSSDLRPFIKFIDSVCAINIGRLVKNQDSTMINNASGTYVKIFLSKTDDDISNGTVLNDHLHIQILRL
ncbi:unnamed protein product [Rotaria magnacalcarata]|uniref:DNA polymerase alpha subunit B n=3 Tax=Rotaria magnacalcarata TaxID=392030 RepID=A0A816XYJ9_9BILA|nr:unnamed protein product [Rotaria magnacalcarata]CAF1601588.1 unnamed protein product [Rotaria magnacalcarata]CAF2152341.1 unnamed protein product [Rotaria magnacalcarata]CAF3899502.1 unnamed protein product [Rotaria magnacalcarata]CAF3901766.1 unnamed protein product [Rotaria magnacalcarata]